MATQLTPAEQVAAFRKWEVDLNLYPGYATRGYGPGSISDAQGIVIHHTGSDAQSDSYLDFLFVEGRPDVPAPLCNWATDMDGDLWLGASERANHAGMGSSATLAKVMSGGTYDWRNSTIVPGVDNINGNSRYYGNEVRFDGGQPMTTAQWRTVILSSAAICDAHGWGAWRVIGHKEHTSRKPDPGNTLMYMIRRDVAAALAAGPGNWPISQEWDDMATKAEVQEACYAAAMKANSDYAVKFWIEATGTGKLLRNDVDALQAAISTLTTKVNTIWNTQIADVSTPESGDTSAAATLLTYAAPRAATQTVEKIQPELNAVRSAIAAVQGSVSELQEKLFPPEPPTEEPPLP